MARELHSDDTKIEQPDPLVDLGMLLHRLRTESERKSDVVVADPKLSQEYLDELAFMAEWVTIRLEPSGQDNAPTTFDVWSNGEPPEVLINGQIQRFPRLPVGPELTVRRFIVEIIARSKTMRVQSDQTLDLRAQLENRLTRSISQTQPFSVISDPSPRGPAWHREMIRRAF